MAPGLENNHVTSILECSAELSCVQSELKISFTVSSLSFRIILNPAEKQEHKEEMEIDLLINVA